MRWRGTFGQARRLRGGERVAPEQREVRLGLVAGEAEARELGGGGHTSKPGYYHETWCQTRSRPRRVAAHAVHEQLEEAVGEVVRVAARLEPRVRPVRGREEDEGGHGHVQVGAELALLDAFAEERADALLVAAALGEELARGARLRGSATRGRRPSRRRAARRRRAGARAGRAAASPPPAAARRSRRARRGTPARPSRAISSSRSSFDRTCA